MTKAAVTRQRARIDVEYEDGTVESFNPNKPRFLLAMERKFKIQVPETHEELYWLAWYALRGSRVNGDGPAEKYDDWVNQVEYVDQWTPPEGTDQGEPPS